MLLAFTLIGQSFVLDLCNVNVLIDDTIKVTETLRSLLICEAFHIGNLIIIFQFI